MQAYRVDTVLRQDGMLTVSNLPLQAGAAVEVIILVQPPLPARANPYPLRGTPITYLNPTDPVAQADWDVVP